MTREEAIQVLKMVEAHGSLVVKAKEMAIKALAEPCEDCISRKAVLKLFTTHDGKYLYEAIRDMPSVQPKKEQEPQTDNRVKTELNRVKNELDGDAISRQAVECKLKVLVNEMETIFADIRERNVDDSVCGLCEYDCDHGIDGYANECPGFERDDCFKLKDEYRKEWESIKELPSVQPKKEQEPQTDNRVKTELNRVKPELEPKTDGDCISRAELLKAIDTWDKFGRDADTKLVPYKDHYVPYIHYDDVIKCIKGMPSVQQESRKGHWIRHIDDLFPVESTMECSACGKHQPLIIDDNYCSNCGAKMESEGKE